MDGIDTNALSQADLSKKNEDTDLDLDKALQGLGFWAQSKVTGQFVFVPLSLLIFKKGDTFTILWEMHI